MNGYDGNIEFWNTYPDLLPKEENLETMKIKRSKLSSMSVLDGFEIQLQEE